MSGDVRPFGIVQDHVNGTVTYTFTDLDWFENRFQHLFLSTTDFTTVVDPLPLLSTVASDLKWLLAASYVVIVAALGIRAIVVGRASASATAK